MIGTTISEKPSPTSVAGPPSTLGTILVIDDEDHICKLISVALRRANYHVIIASNGQEGLELISENLPDLVISDIMMPGIDGLALLSQVRADTTLRSIPFILLTAKGATDDLVAGFDTGADDYLPKPFTMPELLARVKARIERPPIPNDELPRNRQTGLLTERLFTEEVKREVVRVSRNSETSCLAYLAMDELRRVQERLGSRVELDIAKQVAALLLDDSRPLDIVGNATTGHFTLLMPETDSDTARRWLTTLSRRIVAHTFVLGGEKVRLTPTIGFVPFSSEIAVDLLQDHVLAALHSASLNLDLLPVRYNPTMDERWKEAAALKARQARWRVQLWNKIRFPLQIVVVQILTFVIPTSVYFILGALGKDITPAIYIAVVIALLLTAILIWAESLLALRRKEPPAEPGSPYPPVSVIITAYLPNEAATIVESIEAFLRVEYPAQVQIILAYNTPRDLPVEATLQDIARRDPRFQPLRVTNSTSKAQNINAALAYVNGEFIGLFDADHHPAPDSFTRAWRWLSNGYDLVQGHCVIRNGDQSWVSRMIAVEFEVIYALSHPGRNSLHGFGIFGGTNGYWKTDLLNKMRMHGFMLTEDIDSSMRSIVEGYKIVSDRTIISRELAPVTLQMLWTQRMRWAQGWFQVSFTHFWDGVRSPHTSLRQKLGLLHLLIWREIYPWLSIQMIPIIIYWIYNYGGIQRLNWLVPLFILTSVFTLTTGPAQVLMAFFVAIPEIRRQRWWWFFYLIFSSFFYTSFKNLIAAVAQLKHLMREREWKVTPRTVKKPS